MMGFEIQKRHFEGDHPPSVVKPAPPRRPKRTRQVPRIGTIKQQALHRQAEFNEILNVRKVLTCTFAHAECGGETEGGL